MGGAPLGSMPENFGYQVPAEQAIETVRRVLRGPVNFLDTSNDYGAGRSEERIGMALRAEGGLPPGFVVATKVDPDPVTGRFDAARARESAQESLHRLGLDRLPLLYLHDPDDIPFEEAVGPGGVVDGLIALRNEGLVRHLGIAGGPVALMRRYTGTGVFEVLLTHNRFTLVDRSAAELIDDAVAAGIGVVNAAPYGGGILARGTSHTQDYGYRRASDEVLRRIGRMELCRGFGVPLRAAALHFSLRDSRITSTVVGTADAAHVDDLMALVRTVIPGDLWQRLDDLAAPREEWLW
ncbi:MAG TPA: aldo/keto reductase [Streptosporangiaceae bacterium]|nr:aldo/keto reductase [Streptosporangiaceae bacterium]